MLELALEMLTKLSGYFIAFYIAQRCTSNDLEPPPASPFLLDLTSKIAPPRPHNPNNRGIL
jgi:hypothetical protein